MHNMLEVVVIYCMTFCFAAIILMGLFYGIYKLIEDFQDINSLADLLLTVGTAITYIMIILGIMLIINETCVKGVFFHPSLWR